MKNLWHTIRFNLLGGLAFVIFILEWLTPKFIYLEKLLEKIMKLLEKLDKK